MHDIMWYSYLLISYNIMLNVNIICTYACIDVLINRICISIEFIVTLN